MVRQDRQVFFTLSKRRHSDRKDIDTVVEILAESSRPDLGERSRLVAQIKRKSVFSTRPAPTRLTSLFSMTRRSFDWISGASSPISSRNRVPPIAC